VLHIDKDGVVTNPEITKHILPVLEKGRIGVIHGIVVHQTGGATAEAAFAGYAARPEGTHFLIDKAGKIYQTASLLYFTFHAGRLKARCFAEHKCTPTELVLLSHFDAKGEGRREALKPFPARYPGNTDSVGIELVGEYNTETKIYATVTAAQNRALHWLVQELALTLHVSMNEVYRHPQLSYKMETEASTARW
jgi:N-acetyl-anhydromuramyl-L-alanine amidase AmpD